MTFHQIRIFSSIARHLNVTRAAGELHISQPSVTYQLKLLQREFGVRLYEKASGGIHLTRQGKLFLADVEPILYQMRAVEEKYSRQKGNGKSRLLTIGGSSGPSASFLPRLAALFRETHPKTEVALRVDNSVVIEELIANSEVEVAVLTTTSACPELVYERCREEELVFFAPAGYPSTSHHSSMTELAAAPLIIFKRGKTGGLGKILTRMRDRGIALKIGMRCESVEAVKNAVRAGMGVGLLYKDTLTSDIDRGEFEVIRLPGLKMRIDSFVVYHKERTLSNDAKDFLTLLQRSQFAQTKKPLEAFSFHTAYPGSGPRSAVA
jgi:DNA-binding transcriptional LysR family regulator